MDTALGLKSDVGHHHDDRYHTRLEVTNLVSDRITLHGITFTLGSYVTSEALATSLTNNVSTDTENYLKKVDLFTNSIRLGWKEGGDQVVVVPNLATFQSLVARVEALELQVQTLQTQQSTSEVARNMLETTQDSIWAFTTNALTRILALES
jgi:hypothetical protein